MVFPPVELMHTLPGVFYYFFIDGHELRRPIVGHSPRKLPVRDCVAHILAATFRFIPFSVHAGFAARAAVPAHAHGYPAQTSSIIAHVKAFCKLRIGNSPGFNQLFTLISLCEKGGRRLTRCRQCCTMELLKGNVPP